MDIRLSPCLIGRVPGILAFLGLELFLTTGCGPADSKVRPNPPSKQTAADRINVATGNAIQVRWHEKTETGEIRRVLDVDAKSGDLKPKSESGTLRDASGVIYRDDQPKANFTAPFVDANRANDKVTARGGVTITSIDPPGITVTADRVTWYAAKNQIVGEGNIHFVQYREGNPKPIAKGSFDRVTMDTDMKHYSSP